MEPYEKTKGRNFRSMRLYLASPDNQLQAHAATEMPVLLSYHLQSRRKEWIRRYLPSFSHLLIDSGAYSELSSGVVIDGYAYKDWYQEWGKTADAIAGLDDISGNWKKSLANYEKFGGFPTFHDTDPDELLADLIPMARERGNWIGIGLLPPRTNREDFLRRTVERIPDDIHIHGWALRRYAHIRRFNSMDSTNWWRDMLKLSTVTDLQHLTPAECLDIVVKRYKRWQPPNDTHSETLTLF